MAENKVGRPTVMTEAVLNKLTFAFARGLTDREACLYADISTTTLYDYCNENPAFAEQKELLKEQPKMRAKLNVTEAIEEKDVDISKWYLERKAKDEFSAKQQIEADINSEVNIRVELVDDE